MNFIVAFVIVSKIMLFVMNVWQVDQVKGLLMLWEVIEAEQCLFIPYPLRG
jgi:hypothetical protein